MTTSHNNGVTQNATGSVIRANTDANGAETQGLSVNATLSADGTKVVFQSDAANLVDGDNNALADIFVKDLTGVLLHASTHQSQVQRLSLIHI